MFTIDIEHPPDVLRFRFSVFAWFSFAYFHLIPSRCFTRANVLLKTTQCIGIHSNVGEDSPEQEDDRQFLAEILNKLQSIAMSREQWFTWRNELFNPQTVDYTNRDEVMNWFSAINNQFGPRLVGQEPCIKKINRFQADPGVLPKSGALTNCRDGCSRRWVIDVISLNKTSNQ